ncbi:MAG TPA: PRC-barrel domain-containing protein [Nitrospiraceae bacterium]|nr:PRC-barrel domain-containing protein [Nitrospiraceae bacterium]
MLSMYGIIFSEIVIGVALMILLFAPNVNAEMKSDSSSQSNSELQSDRSKTPTQPGQTDITNSQGQSNNLPSRYTVMPVARGHKIDVENSLIGDTVTNPKGEQLGRLERLIKDSETQKVEYAMISIGDTGQYKAFPWSNFKVNKEQGNVVLNMTREQLQPGLAQTDLSPDVTKVVEDQLKTLRTSEPRRAEKRAPSTANGSGGPMGESKASGSGPSGPSALPPSMH